jgi:hypothetical protein
VANELKKLYNVVCMIIIFQHYFWALRAQI